MDYLQPVNKMMYETLPLTDLAAYAMLVLQEHNTPLTIENITVALFRLFPTKFSLVGYPEYPDGMRANRTLMQMQPKYRNYATGSATQGYALTSGGIAAGMKLRRIFGAVSASQPAEAETDVVNYRAERGSGRPRTVHAEDVLKRVRTSRLFQACKDGRFEEARSIDFLAMLDMYSHTPKKVIREQINLIRDYAKQENDADVLGLLEKCTKRFRNIIDG